MTMCYVKGVTHGDKPTANYHQTLHVPSVPSFYVAFQHLSAHCFGSHCFLARNFSVLVKTHYFLFFQRQSNYTNSSTYGQHGVPR